MPIKQAGKKALRTSNRKKDFNLARKETLKSKTKELKKLIDEGKKKEAADHLSKVYKAIDKAKKGGVIKKNKASRKKSQAALLVKNSK